MEKPALLGGTPVRKTAYPQWPVFDERDIEAVTNVVKSGNWGGFPYPGPQTAEFIRRFLALQGGEYAVAMINGTVTMEVACRAAGIGWGDEIIVPAYTFQATAAAPMAAGALPVFVDIDPETYCIDPHAVEAAITDKTRAIIPVHLGAQMADMDALMDIAERHNLIVIEDCAHAHGAKWRGQGAGTLGHFGSFSLQSSKILTAGEGGILICKTQELADRAASIIDCGRPHDAAGRLYTMGANYRMGELQAALANVAIERFPQQAQEREAMAAYMDEALSEIPGVRVLKRDLRHTRRSFYRYIFAIDPDIFGMTHDAVCRALRAEGIPADAGYPPMHQYELFQPHLSRLPVPSAFPEQLRFHPGQFPESERAALREAVWLNENVFRAGSQGVDDVVAALRKVYEHRETLAAHFTSRPSVTVYSPPATAAASPSTAYRLPATCPNLLPIYREITRCFAAGGTLFLCGNGGSMADALHISGELLKSYARRRTLPEWLREKLAAQPDGELLTRNLEPGLRAIVLGANTALNSAVANDMPDRDMNYAQELLALARPGDVLLGISTSGNARNVIYAAQVARALGMTVIAFTGEAGGRLAELSDIALRVPARATARVQELHIQCYHALCEMVENEFFAEAVVGNQ